MILEVLRVLRLLCVRIINSSVKLIIITPFIVYTLFFLVKTKEPLRLVMMILPVVGGPLLDFTENDISTKFNSSIFFDIKIKTIF